MLIIFLAIKHFKFTRLFKGLSSQKVNTYILKLPRYFLQTLQVSERHPLEREGEGEGAEGGGELETKFSVKYPGTLLVMLKD